MGIRLVVVDDNPHVSWEGHVYPVNATFQQFVAALLDLPDSPVDTITSCVPLRAASEAPGTRPLDPRIRVVGTAPFDGIAGYLRHAPGLLRSNRPILGRAIAGAELAWIKVPASNAGLAAAIATRAGVPRFGYVAGSAAGVAAGQGRGVIGGLAASLVGFGYDGAGRLASVGGDRVVVGRDLDRDGIVTSLVEPREVLDRDGEPWPADAGRLELAWAGRVADGKGLEALLEAIALVAAAAVDVRLTLVGAGPARERLAAQAMTLGVGDRVELPGYIADRTTYLATLAAADAFVFPSPAEGFPKVVLDAMAVGLPVIARPSGSLAQLGPALLDRIEADEPAAIADAIRRLIDTPDRAAGLRAGGRTFAAVHTRPAEAARLVARWQARWPDMPWGR